MDENNVPDYAAPGHGGYLGLIDWLNEKLYPVIGPPPLGPYEPIVERIGVALCPVCGRPMSEHFIDHSTPDTILNCPVEPEPVPLDTSPLNEFGMTKHQDGADGESPGRSRK